MIDFDFLKRNASNLEAIGSRIVDAIEELSEGSGGAELPTVQFGFREEETLAEFAGAVYNNLSALNDAVLFALTKIDDAGDTADVRGGINANKVNIPDPNEV